MDGISTVLGSLAMARSAQTIAAPVMHAGEQFAELLGDGLSELLGASGSNDSAPPADSDTAKHWLSKITARVRELIGNPDGLPESLDIELSPLGHVYVQDSALQARQLEATLDNDGPLRQLLENWSNQSGNRQLSISLRDPVTA